MALKGRVSSTNAKKAKITSTNSSGPNQVSISVPAQSGTVTSVSNVASLTDVTVNQTTRGSFLQIQADGANFISTAIVDSDTMTGATSDTSINSGESIKAYIDSRRTETLTLTNKTIDLDANTLTGTLTEFNTALQGDSFVSLTGTEALSNKTLSTPTIGTINQAAGDFLLDASGDIILDADGADIILKDGGTEFGRLTNNSGELRIASGSSTTTNITMSGANTTIAGNLTVAGTTTFTGGSISLGDAATDTVAFTGTITGSLVFEGSTDDSFETTLTPGNPSSDITVSLPTTGGTLPVTAMVSGDATMSTGGALTFATVNSNVGSFGSTTAIPVVTVNAKGLVTAASTAAITTTLTVAADSGSNDSVALADDTLTFTGGSNITTTVSNNDISIALDASPSITNLTLGGTITFEGSTADSFETTLTVSDPDADRTITLPNATDTLVGKATTDTLTNKTIDLGNNTLTGSLAEFNSALQSESFVSLTGSETLTNKQLTTPVIAHIDGTGGIELDAVQDITLDAGGGDVFLKDDGTTFGSLTNSSGNLIVKSGTTTALTFSGANVTAAGNVTVAGNLTVQGSTTTVDSSTINIQNAFVFEGATADSFETTLTTVDPTADRTISLPNATTTLVGKDTTDTLTNKTLTTPVIAEIDSNSSITLDAATDIILDAGEQDIILKDDGTEFGRFSNSSGQLVIKSSSSSTAALTMSGANVQVEGNLTVVGTSSTTGSTITLGNAATDTIALTGTITGNLVFEGSTDDSFETTLSPGNPSSDITLSLPSSGSDTLVGKATTDTLTNKTIDLGNNTLTGSLAEFNTALQGDSFVSLTGSETLTNKTLTSPTINSGTISLGANLTMGGNSIVFEGSTADSFETTLTVTDPTADRTITLPNASDTLVGKATTDTLTNKTLTTPVIEEIDGSTITLDSAGDITLDAGGADIILKDDGTEYGRFTNNSGELQIKSGSSSTTNLTMSGANTTIAGNLTVTGTATANGSTITLGDSASDTVSFGATITGNLVFEGSTDDSFETTLIPGNPSADISLTLPSSGSDTLVGKATTDTLTNKTINSNANTLHIDLDDLGTFTGTLSEFNAGLQGDSFVSLTGSETLTNKVLTSPTINSPTINSPTIIFEGSTADSFETTLAVTDPTADRTITLPNATDTLVGKATTDTLTNKTLTSPLVSGLSLTDSSIVFEGSSSNSFETTLTVTNPTADRTITLQDGSGTLAFLTDVTGGGAAGSFTNLTTTGNVILGDASSDTVVYNARVNSHILPAANDTYDLGSDALRWRTLFVSASTIDLGGATISSDSSGSISISAAGATLPVGSKVGTQAIAKANEATGKTVREVSFFKKGNLSTANATFEFAASGNLSYVFRAFTKTDGTALTTQEETIFLF